MGLVDRIPGLSSGYRWIDSKSQTVRGVLFVGALIVFIGLGTRLPEGGAAPTPQVVVLLVVAYLALIVAVLSLISLTYPWLDAQPRLIRFGAVVAAIVVYLLLPREGVLGTVSMGISFLLLAIAALALWSIGSEFRQNRGQESRA